MSQPPPGTPPSPNPRRGLPPTVSYERGVPLTGARPGEELPPAPPPPPRAVTPAARRRSFLEPQVRFWWLATLVMATIAVWFLIQQFRAYFNEQRLIRSGVPVTAVIEGAGGDNRKGHYVPSDSACTLTFTWNGQPVRVPAGLTPKDNAEIFNGEEVHLRVDPNDPTIWTDRATPEPVSRRMIAGVVILPVLLASLLAALLLRRRMLRIWRDGEAHAYVVIDVKHTALAPLSAAVRCALHEGRDNRLITVYVPNRLARPTPGGFLWLIRPKNKSKPAIAALAFEGGSER